MTIGSLSLGAYASFCIDQEVRAEGLTRDVGAFARFWRRSLSHGGQLNLSAVARECEVERGVAAAYVGILDRLRINGIRCLGDFLRRIVPGQGLLDWLRL